MAAPYPMKYVAPVDGADPELEPQPVTIYDLPAVPTTAQVRTAVATKPQIVALTADTASTATDVAGLLVDHNDLVSKYNALLAALKA